MKKRLLLVSAALALVAGASLAAVLGFAGTGKAASTNTCTLTNNQPDCFKVIVSPIFITTGQTGTIDAKFSNTFGTANASHTTISFGTADFPLPNGITVTKVATSAPATCSAPTDRPIVCDFNNVPNGRTVVMRLYITSSAPLGQIAITGTLAFAESNGSNGNDTFSATGTAESVDGTKKAGYCTTSATKFVKSKQVPLLSASDLGQIVTIESLAGAPAAGDCTAIAGGVEPRGSAPITTDVSIVAFAGTGTVTLLFPGRDASTFTLKELSIDPSVSGWIVVGNCPGFVPGTDSCIVSETNVTIKGIKYVQDVLTVTGAPPDGHYGG